MSRVALSPRDEGLLRFVGQVRLASARQLELMAFPATEHGSALTAARRARRTLQRLTDHRVLTRLDRRIGGVRSGSSGYLYSVGPLGRRALGLPGRARLYEPSARFVDHTLAATEVHVALIEAERAGLISDVRVVHEPAGWRRFAGRHGDVEVLKPDLLIELDAATGWSLRWFVEVDLGTEHLPTVLNKCRVYQRYWRSGAEASISDVFPRVLWSVPDEARGARIESAIAAERRLHRDLFRVAMASDTTAALINHEPHQKGGEP
jgi:hypothetical protein